MVSCGIPYLLVIWITLNHLLYLRWSKPIQQGTSNAISRKSSYATTTWPTTWGCEAKIPVGPTIWQLLQKIHIFWANCPIIPKPELLCSGILWGIPSPFWPHCRVTERRFGGYKLMWEGIPDYLLSDIWSFQCCDEIVPYKYTSTQIKKDIHNISHFSM